MGRHGSGIARPGSRRHPHAAKQRIGLGLEIGTALRGAHPVALQVALEPGRAVDQLDGQVDADLLELFLVDRRLVGELHHLADHHFCMETVRVARLGHQRLGLGDVIRMLLAVKLPPAGQLGDLLRRAAEPHPHAQRRAEAVLPWHPERFEQGLAIYRQVDGLPHLRVVERRHARIHVEESHAGVLDVFYSELVSRFLLELLQFLAAQVADRPVGCQDPARLVGGDGGALVLDGVMHHAVDIGQPVLPVVLVLLQRDRDVLDELAGLERPGAHGVLPFLVIDVRIRPSAWR